MWLMAAIGLSFGTEEASEVEDVEKDVEMVSPFSGKKVQETRERSRKLDPLLDFSSTVEPTKFNLSNMSVYDLQNSTALCYAN